jgi:hypothetical protein
VFAAGHGEAGLDHYEVRSWVGWHHHKTLSLVALWFLCLERRRFGEKTPAVTVPQMRQIFTRLLWQPAPTPEEIAEVVSRVLRRNQESRIYLPRTQDQGEFPPGRRQPDTSWTEAPTLKRLQ